MKKAYNYDFETLSTDPFTGAVVCLAGVEYDEDRFLTDPYEFQELVDMSKVIKFDVKEQVQKYNRKIDKGTLAWWKNLPPAARKVLTPTKKDVSISKLYDWLISNFDTKGIQKVYTRGNTFDPIFLKSIFDQTGHTDPFVFWKVRDVRSTIDALTWGEDIKNTFMVPDLKDLFIAHDPAHDVAMDVMRVQYLIRLIIEE